MCFNGKTCSLHRMCGLRVEVNKNTITIKTFWYNNGNSKMEWNSTLHWL
jgi:hypothetical protein